MSHLGFIERRIPYPIRAAKLSIEFTLFPWWKPRFHHNSRLTEDEKQLGITIWYMRWLWVQIAYSRWI